MTTTLQSMTRTTEEELDLLTPREAAELLRTTPGQLSQYRFHRTGPDFFQRGRKILYRRCDLVDYVTKSLVTASVGRG